MQAEPPSVVVRGAGGRRAAAGGPAGGADLVAAGPCRLALVQACFVRGARIARTKLHVDDGCELLQIKRNTWMAYVSRGQAPAADGFDDPMKSVNHVARPWWWSTTINEYQPDDGAEPTCEAKWGRLNDGARNLPNGSCRFRALVLHSVARAPPVLA